MLVSVQRGYYSLLHALPSKPSPWSVHEQVVSGNIGSCSARCSATLCCLIIDRRSSRGTDRLTSLESRSLGREGSGVGLLAVVRDSMGNRVLFSMEQLAAGGGMK